MSGSLGPVSVIGVFVWYIEGPKEKILVDSGMTWDIYEKMGVTGHTHVQTLREGLAKYHLEPGDIDIILQTHLHLDHRALATEFTKARFIIQQAELDYNLNPPPPPIEPMPCPKDFIEQIRWEPVNGDTRIVEGVETIFTPGHTPGGQSIAVETSQGTAIIDGLCTTFSNWNVPKAMQSRFEFFNPGIHSDTTLAYKSLKRIKETAAIRVPSHEVRWSYVERIPETAHSD